MWLVENGEYEQHAVFGIYSSLDRAIAGIKDSYGEPYIVSWDEPVKNGDIVSLTGHFESVVNYSMRHIETFDISEQILDKPSLV